MSDALLIRMQPCEAECGLCGAVTEFRWGVPTFNGDLVSNDFPRWLWADSGGSMAACRPCFERHERGELGTFDQLYLHLAGGFVGGDGI